MSNRWPTHRIDGIASRNRWALNGGPFGSKLVSAMYTESGVPVLRGSNLPMDARFNDSGFVFVSEEKALELKQHEATSGDLIITQRGTLGQIGIIPVDARYKRYIVSQSQMKLTVDPEKADGLFIYYVFRSPEIVERIHGMALRSGVPHINLSLLRAFTISLPDVSIQKRIAARLSAYDDLIEVNRRRVAILEEMARRLFEEWFVHLRFPGHETVPVHDTPDGPLPEGWTWQPLSHACLHGNGIQTGPFGSQLHQSDYSDSGVPVVMPKDLVDFRVSTASIARIPETLADALGRHRMREGDIVYGRRGDIGRRAYIAQREHGWFCGTGSLRLRPDIRHAHPRYLFEALGLRKTLDSIRARAQGATMPNLGAGVLATVPVLMPPLPIQNHYSNAIDPFCNLVTALLETNARLNSARDLLLPRLVSGELSLTDAPAPERMLEAAD